jgi:hypothetical protein
MSGFAAITENPEYQKTMRRLMQTPPAVRALVNTGDVDAAFMADYVNKDFQLQKLGQAKLQDQQKLNLLEKGIGNSQSYYNLRTQNVEDVLDLENKSADINNAIGLARVGLSGYGMWKNNKLKNQLLGV